MKTVEARVIKTPNSCNGSARLIGTRIPIWMLAQMKRKGWADETIREAYPDLTQLQLDVAWEYVASHPGEIAEELRGVG